MIQFYLTNCTSLVLLWTGFASGFGEDLSSILSALSLATGCLSLFNECPSLATGCLASWTLLTALGFLSSDEVVTVDAALTSAAVDIGGGEAFFWSFLKNRLPEETFFSSLSLSPFKIKRPSLFEAWNYYLKTTFITSTIFNYNLALHVL